MDRQLKNDLRKIYSAPAPVRKASFLKQHRRLEICPLALLRTQAVYIRWWVWGLSALLFGASILFMRIPDDTSVWQVAALIPFLALIAVVENGKSNLYGMAELELSCRFSMRSTVLARMAILGLFHLILLTILTPVLAMHGTVGMLRAGIYLFVPYLLTTVLSMEVSRRIPGREGLLACMGCSLGVSALGTFLQWNQVHLYCAEYTPFWIAAALLLLPWMTLEFSITIKRTEELSWSLSSMI